MTFSLSGGISTTLTDITMMDNVKFFLSVRITLIIIDYTLFVLIAIKVNCTQFTINYLFLINLFYLAIVTVVDGLL